MKNTEQRWMHISTGLLVERGRKPDNSANDYRPVTVTWDVPEWEEVEAEAHALSPDYVNYVDTDGIIKSIPTDAKLKVIFRRRKPEPEPEVWETRILSRDCAPHRSSRLEVISDDEDLHGKKVRVEVVE